MRSRRKKSKYIKIISIILIFVVLAIATFFFLKKTTQSPSNNSEESSKILPTEEEILNKKVEDTLASMTLEQKIAQTIIITRSGGTIDDVLDSIMKTYQPGGFILMGNNITTYEKTKNLVSGLQSYSNIPMIISIDEEGGLVQRTESMTDIPPTYIPPMYYLGKTNDKELAYEVGSILAKKLRTIGVNVDYAPVLDIYSNPKNTVIGTRSFGTTADQVSSMALSLSKGLEDNGVIATYKHFPGHGDTATDSHYDLPIINKTYEELKELELIPFKNAIASGAEMIMVGHLSLPNIIGDKTPSSLSKKIITDILRKDMNYDGLVITDALNMGALANNYSPKEIYTMAINAGVDLLLIMNGDISEAIESVKNNIPEERINEPVTRILKFKYSRLEDYKWLDSSYLNKPEYEEAIKKINTNN